MVAGAVAGADVPGVPACSSRSAATARQSRAVARRTSLHGLLEPVLELLRALLEIALRLFVLALLLQRRRAGRASGCFLDLAARSVALVAHLAPPRSLGRSVDRFVPA